MLRKMSTVNKKLNYYKLQELKEKYGEEELKRMAKEGKFSNTEKFKYQQVYGNSMSIGRSGSINNVIK